MDYSFLLSLAFGLLGIEFLIGYFIPTLVAIDRKKRGKDLVLIILINLVAFSIIAWIVAISFALKEDESNPDAEVNIFSERKQTGIRLVRYLAGIILFVVLPTSMFLLPFSFDAPSQNTDLISGFFWYTLTLLVLTPLIYYFAFFHTYKRNIQSGEARRKPKQKTNPWLYVALPIGIVAVLALASFFFSNDRVPETNETDQTSSAETERMQDNMNAKESLSSLRAEAEVYFSDNGNYEGVCSSSYFEILLGDIKRYTGNAPICHATAEGFYTYVTLKSGEMYCADSTGFLGEMGEVPSGDGMCVSVAQSSAQ